MPSTAQDGQVFRSCCPRADQYLSAEMPGNMIWWTFLFSGPWITWVFFLMAKIMVITGEPV